MVNDYQRGTSPYRLEGIVETTVGQTPSDPSWDLFSDNVVSAFDWEPDANTNRQDSVGEITAQGFFNGAETHEASFEYHLQNWYTDGSGNRNEAGYDFLEPASDNDVRATHSVVGRSDVSSGGTDGAGRRIYTVAKGGHPSSMTVPFETEDGTPINQSLEYQFEKIRQYDISQPSSSTTLDITNNGSSSVDVSIENEGASTEETNTVGSGATVTTTDSFGDIDAVELSTDVDGSVDVTDGSGTTFVSINGSDSYPTGEGDLGVPTLGSGSHASAIGSSYIRFIDDDLTVPNVGSDYEVISGEMSVDTGLNAEPRAGDGLYNIHAEEWSYTVTASLAGPKMSIDQTQNYLTESTGTLTWDESSGESIDFNNSFIQSPGTYTKEANQGKMIFDNEWTAETITVS
jgi:hypothetical protein